MYLFSRRARLRSGGIAEATAWAMGITERVHQITGVDVALWSAMFGPEVGTVAWTATFPDLAALETAFDKVQADPSFLAEASRGEVFAPEGPSDRLLRFIHPDEDTLARRMAEATSRPSYVNIVTSVALPGAGATSIDLGVRIAVRAEEITGVPVAFLADTTGAYGQMSWIAAYPDIETMERTETALALDADWLQMLDREVPGVFTDAPGATTQLVYRRLV